MKLLVPWLRKGPQDTVAPVFPSTRGGSLSRDAVERLVTRHRQTAARRCPSLKRKTVTPHVLRHTAAMELLQHGIDRAVIALWLGHESVETTQMYPAIPPGRQAVGLPGGPLIMPRHTTNNPRDSPTFLSGEEPSRHNPARGIMTKHVRRHVFANVGGARGFTDRFLDGRFV